MQTNLKHMDKFQNRRNKDNQNLHCHWKKNQNQTKRNQPKKDHYDLKDNSEAACIKLTAFQPAPLLENRDQASGFYKTP